MDNRYFLFNFMDQSLDFHWYRRENIAKERVLRPYIVSWLSEFKIKCHKYGFSDICYDSFDEEDKSPDFHPQWTRATNTYAHKRIRTHDHSIRADKYITRLRLCVHCGRPNLSPEKQKQDFKPLKKTWGPWSRNITDSEPFSTYRWTKSVYAFFSDCFTNV